MKRYEKSNYVGIYLIAAIDDLRTDLRFAHVAKMPHPPSSGRLARANESARTASADARSV